MLQRAHQVVLLSVLLCLCMTRGGQAQERQSSSKPVTRAELGRGVGIELFGGAGITWPVAKESFETVALRANPIEFGGGARLVGLWAGMFLQVSGGHWSDTGDRVFIDSDGTRFPLGIPLDVKATFVDGTIGLKRAVSKRRNPDLLYFGAGVGRVQYSERSPFSELGEDVGTGRLSYHALAGLEMPIAKRVAVIVDTKYRYIPDVLGEGGVSAAVGEDAFGGFNASVGLRIGVWRRSALSRGGSAPSPSKPSPPTSDPGSVVSAEVPRPAPRQSEPRQLEGTILDTAPTYIVPDASRTPLRTLDPGTRVIVQQQKGDWLQVEFNDSQFGRRVSWVLKRFVRLPDK